LAVAKIELDQALAAMREVEADLEALEDVLAARGAPFTPGRGVPAWTLAD
jgi:hypothetical protein